MSSKPFRKRFLNPVRIGCLAAIAAPVAVLGALCWWVDSRMTYYTLSYKSTEVIASGDLTQLRARNFPVEFAECTVHFEWFTYDNADITQGPYKLFVVLEPQGTKLTQVEILQIDLTSSQGNAYQFAEDQSWPVILQSKDWGTRTSYTFEPAFAFDFHGEERIHSRISIRLTRQDGARVETIEIEWAPIRVRHFAPLV